MSDEGDWLYVSTDHECFWAGALEFFLYHNASQLLLNINNNDVVLELSIKYLWHSHLFLKI